MSYIIKFSEDKFIVSSDNEILVIDYDKYYSELKDFLVEFDFIELTMEREMRYFFLTIKFGLFLYKSEYFTKFNNTNIIPFYDLAKIVYIFYINNIL